MSTIDEDRQWQLGWNAGRDAGRAEMRKEMESTISELLSSLREVVATTNRSTNIFDRAKHIIAKVSGEDKYTLYGIEVDLSQHVNQPNYLIADERSREEAEGGT